MPVVGGTSVSKDMHRWLRYYRELQLEPYWIQVPLFDATQMQVVETWVPVIAPHEWLHALHSRGPATWSRIMLGDNPPGVVLEWWEWALSQPFGAVHPAATDMSVLDEMFPLLFHYDGCESFTNQEAHIWSFGSAFGMGSCFDAKFIMLVLLNAQMPTADIQAGVHSRLCEFIGWSLKFCMSGKAPTDCFEHGAPFDERRRSLGGEWLAAGRRCRFGGLKMDRKAVHQVHGFRQHYQCGFVCESC